MRGTVLSFHPETNTGLISGHDGVRYTFSRADWTSPKIEPVEDLVIDFDTDENDKKKALQIIVIKSKAYTGSKTKKAATLWALFLGGIGAHKFYLGKTGAGILYLLFFWTGIPMLIALIEVIMLVLMDEEDFNRKYNY